MKLVKISSWQNGTHSLAEGIRSFENFHKDPKSNPLALKDAILRSHHGLETLFKLLLQEENPVLLLHDKETVGQIVKGYESLRRRESNTLFDEFQTINLEETIKRLRRMNVISIGDVDYQRFLSSVKELTNLRNDLQHFELDANEDLVGRVLGVSVPGGVDIIESTPKEFVESPWGRVKMTPQPRMLTQELLKFYPAADKTIELLRTTYDKLVVSSIKFFKGRQFKDRILNLKIRDLGHVGAPPYVPEISSKGFLNLQLDRMPFLNENSVVIGGSAQTKIGKPSIKEVNGLGPSSYWKEVSVSGNIEIEFTLQIGKGQVALNLEGAEDQTSMLRRLYTYLKIAANYEARSTIGSPPMQMISLDRLTSVEGSLEVRLQAFPKGYEDEAAELEARYSAKLDLKNAPFTLHGRLGPDGAFDEHSYLEWSIFTKSDLIFAG